MTSPTTMKEAFIHDGPIVRIIDTPIPIPGAGQVLIRVHVTGSNPKDWKTWWVKEAINQGNDIAGTIHSVGEGVVGFQAGDRVFALHELQAPHGSFAEYSVAWAGTTAHIPEHVFFAEASTIPLAAMTAALSLYRGLALPQPWTPRPSTAPPLPLLVYGASSAVGAFAVKLAIASNIHPIIAVGGVNLPFVKSIIRPSKGDIALDYREGEEAITSALKVAGLVPHYALDAISEHGSLPLCARLLERGGLLAHVLPLPEDFKEGTEITTSLTMVGEIHGMFGQKPGPGAHLFGEMFMHAFARGLEKGGWMSGHPWETIEGLEGLQLGLERMKEGEIRGKKLVYRLV